MEPPDSSPSFLQNIIEFSLRNSACSRFAGTDVVSQENLQIPTLCFADTSLCPRSGIDPLISSCSNYIFTIYYSIATQLEEMNNDSTAFLFEYLGLDE
jgi:hypothetical protein